jgi:hypothetical protein
LIGRGKRQVLRIAEHIRRHPVDKHLVRAIELQLGLRASVATLERQKSVEGKRWSVGGGD